MKQDMDDFESTMQLNYFGTLRVIKAALPSMVERRQGEIVLVSSAAAVVGAQHLSRFRQALQHQNSLVKPAMLRGTKLSMTHS